MMQRADAPRTCSAYDDMPFSQVLFRYLWPFWLFKDASRGDRYARAAAYRHNRSMRTYLPGYMLKWLFSSGLAFAALSAAESLAHDGAHRWDMFTLLVGAGAIAFVASLCVLFLTGYIYLYLDRHEG